MVPRDISKTYQPTKKKNKRSKKSAPSEGAYGLPVRPIIYSCK